MCYDGNIEKKVQISSIFLFLQVFLPGRDKLEEGEHLEYDSTAYDMLHSLQVDWPCLSFDIIQDKLGAQRTKVSIFID